MSTSSIRTPSEWRCLAFNIVYNYRKVYYLRELDCEDWMSLLLEIIENIIAVAGIIVVAIYLWIGILMVLAA